MPQSLRSINHNFAKSIERLMRNLPEPVYTDYNVEIRNNRQLLFNNVLFKELAKELRNSEVN